MRSGRTFFAAALLLSFIAPLTHAQLNFAHIADDQKRIWTAPANLQHRKYLVEAGVVMVTTGALLAFDPAEARYFRGTTSFNQFNRVFSSNITGYGTVATAALLYAAGLIRHDAKMQNTTFSTGEAVVDAELLAVVLKNVTHRTSPGAMPAGSDMSGSWFQQSGPPTLRGNGSFPSGHTISAFAAATVISRRYSNHKWVPVVAYGLAGAIGFSRMTLSAHYASDVFLGGALGYTIGRITTPDRKVSAGF